MFILNVCESIPAEITNLIATIVTLIKIAVPVILVILGMLDLGKSVLSQKEDEIKKGQQIFIKRLIAAGLVFFVVAIAQFVVGIANGGDNDNNFWECAAGILGA